MGLPVVVFPDVEALVISYLGDHLEGVQVGSEFPESLESALPVVVVSLLDAAEALDFVLEDAAVDVEVLAADKAAASDLARLVAAHMKAMPGTPLAGATVYSVDRQGFTWVPDEPTELPRYVLTFELRVRPA